MKRAGILSVATIMVVLNIVSKVLGLAKEMIVAALFGVGEAVDAYSISLSITSLIPLMLMSYIGTTFVANYTKKRVQLGDEAAQSFTNQTFSGVLLITSVLSILCYLLSPQLINLFAPGFSQGQKDISVPMLRVLSLVIVLNCLVSLFNNLMHARRIHILPLITTIVSSTFTIVLLVAFYAVLGAYSLAASLIGATMMAALFAFLMCLRNGERFRLTVLIPKSEIKQFIVVMIPSVTASSMPMIHQYVSQVAAARLSEGSVSVLHYALLIGSVFQMFTMPLLTIYFTRVCEQAALNERKKTVSYLLWFEERMVALTIPIVLCVFFTSEPIVRALFERKMFTVEDTAATATVLSAYMLIFLFQTLSDPVSRIYIAYQSFKRMVGRGMISVVVNISLCILLVRSMGLIGVVLAAAGGHLTILLLDICTLRYRWGRLGLLSTLKESGKMLCAAGLCALVLWIYKTLLYAPGGFLDSAVYILGGAVISLVTFILACLLLQTRCIMDIKQLIFTKVSTKLIKVKKGRGKKDDN